MNPAIIKAKTAKPLDRRARRTRQAIKESFAALAANRPFPDLTVKEVMERAGVNRATFYAHFSNIEDLERAMETDAAERVIERATRMRESEEHREGDLAVALVCLLDDRDAAPGVQFADADLLGAPVRVIVSKRNLANGEVEIVTRDKSVQKKVKVAEAEAAVAELLAE